MIGLKKRDIKKALKVGAINDENNLKIWNKSE